MVQNLEKTKKELIQRWLINTIINIHNNKIQINKNLNEEIENTKLINNNSNNLWTWITGIKNTIIGKIKLFLEKNNNGWIEK